MQEAVVSNPSSLPVADAIVVGAGPLGLATATALRARGIEPLVLERGDRVAHRWRGRYRRLRLNTPRERCAMPQAAAPNGHGRWLPLSAYVGHLEDYARERGLRVVPDTEATRIDRAGDQWRVDTNGDVLHAPIVVVATGLDAEPRFPEWPGHERFTGTLIHAADYTVPEPFVDRDVLVVGTGSSGLDIAVDLARHGARRVRVSMRHVPNLMPRAFGGVAMLPYGLAILMRAGMRGGDALGRAMQRATYGDLRALGLRPEHGIITDLLAHKRPPVIDDTFVAALREGIVSLTGAVAGFAGSDVLLADGSRIQPEIVIAATGYVPGLERLVGHLDVLDAQGAPRATGAQTLPHAPGLFFAGFDRPQLPKAIRIANSVANAAGAFVPQRGLR